MLRQKQKQQILDLYKKGKKITQIAKDLKTSRHTIYKVIKENAENKLKTGGTFSQTDVADIENDAEIIELKKDLRKAELQKKIKEMNNPMETEKKIAELEKAICNIILDLMYIKDLSSNVPWEEHFCYYCADEKLEFFERKDASGYECRKCGRVFKL